MVLAESGAIVQYLLTRYCGERLAPDANQPNFAQYLYWFHFANANLQSHMGLNMILNRLQLPVDNPILTSARVRLACALEQIDHSLGEASWLAGDDLTAADIMMVFSLSTMRYFTPVEL